MSEYKDLTERLRGESVVVIGKHGTCVRVEENRLCAEAADAIEELSKYANTMRRLKCEGWYLQQNKYHDGYQAVATMPLPEPPGEEQK